MHVHFGGGEGEGGVEKYYCSSSRSCRRKYEEESIIHSPGWVSWRVDHSSSKESVFSSIPLFFVKRNSWYRLSIAGWSFPCSVECRLAITITTRGHEFNESFTVQKRRRFHFIYWQKSGHKSFHAGELWGELGTKFFKIQFSTYTALVKCEETNVLPIHAGWGPGIEVHSVVELSGPNRIVVFVGWYRC
jgi:hypothetical protein